MKVKKKKTSLCIEVLMFRSFCTKLIMLVLSRSNFITLKSFVNFKSLIILPTLVRRTNPFTLLLSNINSNGSMETMSIRNQDFRYWRAITPRLSIKTYLESKYAVLKIRIISIKKQMSINKSFNCQTRFDLSVNAILNGVAKHANTRTKEINRSQPILPLSSGYNMQGLRFI